MVQELYAYTCFTALEIFMKYTFVSVHVPWAFYVCKTTPFLATDLTQSYVTTFGWKPFECKSKFASYIDSVMN